MTLAPMLGAALLAVVLAVLLLALALVTGRAVRRWRTARLEAIAEPVRPLLLQMVADDGPASEERRQLLASMEQWRWRAVEPVAIAMLSKVRGDAHQRLVQLLTERGTVDAALRDVRRRGAVRRARAAEMLGSVGRRQATGPLVLLLDDRDPEVRQVAARALGRLRDPAAADPLLAHLHGPRSVPMNVVAHALVRLGSAAEAALVVATRDEDPLLRAAAVEILGLGGSLGAFGVIEERLRQDPELEVRIRAARALGRLGSPAAHLALVEATEDDQPWPLRAVAARALGGIGVASTAAALGRLACDPVPRVADNAAMALLRLGPTGIKTLQELAARDGHPAAVAGTALTLGSLRGVTDAAVTDPHGGAALVANAGTAT